MDAEGWGPVTITDLLTTDTQGEGLVYQGHRGEGGSCQDVGTGHWGRPW